MSKETPSTVLIIDDDKHIREYFIDYLTEIGYITYEALNAKQGIEIFLNDQPDIVLVDLRMPDIDGLEVLKQIKNISEHTPVIIVSGEGILDDAIESLRLGAWDYVVKPVNLDILSHTIKKGLKHLELINENKDFNQLLKEQVRQRTSELEQANIVLNQRIENDQYSQIALKESEKLIQGLNSKVDALKRSLKKEIRKRKMAEKEMILLRGKGNTG